MSVEGRSQGNSTDPSTTTEEPGETEERENSFQRFAVVLAKFLKEFLGPKHELLTDHKQGLNQSSRTSLL